jgi:UDP-N-acetylmuramate: L-alanyl-gamma-D-glutamyl-meso-diaminopimelate ligase
MIPRGQLIIEYVGEVITSTEATRRERSYSQLGLFYLHDIHAHKREHESYVLDPTMYGNAARMLNHSCEPNVTTLEVSMSREGTQKVGVSARVGESPFFVIEADEYDSAFFDKRSKFVHYRPKTLVINNLEFDHADIFADLAAIQTQFHHLVRMVPENGLILTPNNTPAIEDMLSRGCWSSRQSLGKTWDSELINKDGSAFHVLHNGNKVGTIEWALMGKHNVDNALMAIASSHHAGVTLPDAIEALSTFKNVKRRMEVKGTVSGITVYDDFAHHPTAIESTLDGLRKKVGNARILAVLEPRSNTMKMGVHKNTLANSWQKADDVFLFEPSGMDWSLVDAAAHSSAPVHCYKNVEHIVQALKDTAKPGDHILVMSNGGFEGIHGRILSALKDC